MILHTLIQVILLMLSGSSSAETESMAKPNCTSMCGNVSIPYPFGMGKECYHDDWFAITCNDVTKKPFLSKFNMEVMMVDLKRGKITVMNPVASNCGGQQKGNTSWSSTNFSGSPYAFNPSYNTLVVVGCDSSVVYNHNEYVSISCLLICEPDYGYTRYSKLNYCQNSTGSYTDKLLTSYTISIKENTTVRCTYAFLGDVNFLGESHYSTPSFFNNIKQAPISISWELKNLDSNKYCRDLGVSYYCECPWTHIGNPYLPNGCKRVCADCDRGYDDFGSKNTRETILGWVRSSLPFLFRLFLHSVGGLFLILLCGFCFWMFKVIKKRRIASLKKMFFERNGGLLLEQQISSDESTVKKTIIFTSDELLKATDNYNENRILGQGGQGTVYKGMLTDGSIAAVKKSKVVDKSQLTQFINEVIILSQMNHRNIVKLLGCCLETEVPLLVYEFVLNGTLYDLIHTENEDFPLSWKMRLQIATEVARGLAYLHSASSVPIYHRDIKSKNILLDEKFRAKISDFGTSRSIAIEQTHLTTVVCGTFGYLDPEYFHSSHFTDKSDVYSFGVVLVELLTGQKPISLLNEFEEQRGLAARFISCIEQMRVFDIVDGRIVEEAPKEDIVAVSDLAMRCLNSNGKKRPTMKDVMMELEEISRVPSALVTTSFEQDTFNVEKNENRLEHDGYSTLTMIMSDYRASSSSDVNPLVFYSL